MKNAERFYHEKRDTQEGLEEFYSLDKETKLIENFFDFERYEESQKIIDKFIEDEKYEELKDFARRLLVEKGMEFFQRFNTKTPEGSSILVESVNYAAKAIDEAFYLLKPALILAAFKSGCKLGVERDGYSWDTYYLTDKKTGVSSYHDPGGEVYRLFTEKGMEDKIQEWEHGWSGISRQEESFYLAQALENPDDPKSQLFLKKMKYKTIPGDNALEKYKISNNENRKR